MEHLDSLSIFEETVSELCNRIAADFIGLVLTEADRMIRSGIREEHYY